MKPQSIPPLLSVLVIAIVGLSLISVPVAASGVGTWKSSTSYPTNIENQSCSVSAGYIFCVGGTGNGIPSGATNAVYFASLSSSGVGAWKATKSYPEPIYFQSCKVFGTYIYCVGGVTTSGPINAVYFAKLSSSGVGTWTATTPYPATIYLQSCVSGENYIYCVGGFLAGNNSNAVYFASLSSSGVGAWKATSSYPTTIDGQSCRASGGYIYCVGGSTLSGPIGNAVYFAKQTSSGVGTWKSTTSYPTNIEGQSCSVSGPTLPSYIYCVGGSTPSITNAVYLATLTSSGVGTWKSSTSYPTNIEGQSCGVSGGYIYCVGGSTTSSPITLTNAVYFASV